jgi:hypothetical protein
VASKAMDCSTRSRRVAETGVPMAPDSCTMVGECSSRNLGVMFS